MPRIVKFIVLPFRFFVDVIVWFFNVVISRYVVAGVFWGPFYFLDAITYEGWLWHTGITGLILTGLWDGCSMFQIRRRDEEK